MRPFDRHLPYHWVVRVVEEDDHRDSRFSAATYEVPDVSVGDPEGDGPLEALTWQDSRDEIYGALLRPATEDLGSYRRVEEFDRLPKPAP